MMLTADELPFAPPGLELSAPLWERVLEAYGEPHRVYHDVRHLFDVLARFDEVSREIGSAHPREVYLALLFHDAVYTPGATGNEEASAELASLLLAHANVDVALVAHLVRLTARHGQLSVTDVTAEEALFLDCDMAVLGGTTEEYDVYEADVAREYAALSPLVFAAGRRRFLDGLLARERIFLSEFFQHRREGLARENIRRAIVCR